MGKPKLRKRGCYLGNCATYLLGEANENRIVWMSINSILIIHLFVKKYNTYKNNNKLRGI